MSQSSVKIESIDASNQSDHTSNVKIESNDECNDSDHISNTSDEIDEFKNPYNIIPSEACYVFVFYFK